MTSRDNALDIMRGFAILLVVLFRSATVLRSDFPIPEWLQAISAVSAPIRMPAMVFLSGLLVAPSLRKGVKAYISGKVRRVAWPYALWSAGFVLLLAIAAPAENSFAALLEIPTDPVEHMWFLYYLMGYYILALLTLRFRTELLVGALLLVNVVAIMTGWNDLQVFGFLGVFFFAGVAISWNHDWLGYLAHSKWVLFAAIASSLAIVAIAVLAGEVRYVWFLVPIVFFTVLGALRAARLVADQRWTLPLAFLGVESLVFYIAHYPAMIIASNAAQRLTSHETILLAIVITSGLGVPYLLTILLRRLPFSRWLFQFAPSRRLPRKVVREPF